MLYVIKDDKLYIKVSGEYNPEDYESFTTIEDERTELVYNSETKELEERKRKEPTEVESFTFPNYIGLYESMRGSDVWNKITNDGSKTLKINIAVTMLIAAVTATKSVEGLKDALKAYVEAIADSSQATDLSDEQIEEMQEAFDSNNIDVQMSEVLADGE